MFEPSALCPQADVVHQPGSLEAGSVSASPQPLDPNPYVPSPYVWQLLPDGLIYKSYLAGLKEPRLGTQVFYEREEGWKWDVTLGGRVGKAKSSEVGVMQVSKTKAGEADPVLADLSNPLQVLQWHGAEVSALPPGGTTLASSDACEIQALRVGKHAYGFQFHVEVSPRTVPDWAVIPEYACALEKAMGPDGMEQLQSQVSKAIGNFNRDARRLYEGLKRSWTG